MSAHAVHTLGLHDRSTRPLALTAQNDAAPAVLPAAEIPSLSITWHVPGPALAHMSKVLAVPTGAKAAVVECRVSSAAGVVLCVRFTDTHDAHTIELLRLRPATLRCERDEHGFTHLDADGLVAISITDDARISYVRTDLSTRLGLPGGTYAAPDLAAVESP